MYADCLERSKQPERYKLHRYKQRSTPPGVRTFSFEIIDFSASMEADFEYICMSAYMYVYRLSRER